ncbi:MAG TPA: hypothetical protein PLB89_04660 [Flavobacteriales bacterium]|nr:hypothetical protein [Flavobacteriales bacterium]
MSLFLDIVGRLLHLKSGTTAQVEHIAPLFADGIEDGYSLPIELPTQGNETVLGHVHELSLQHRQLSFPKSRLGHHGMPLIPGTFDVLATNTKTVRGTFLVEAFVSLMRGVMLPDTLRSKVIDTLQQYMDGFTFHHRPLFEDGGDLQFPMFYNPSQYGDERPGWFPSVSPWDENATYAVNKEVQFTEFSPVKRTWIYQCIVDTAAGESPLTTPSSWRRASYGLVNAWDKLLEQHYLNTLTSDFYTLVPWFYLKWVIRESLASQGFRAIGDFMDDERTHELLLPNTATIDAPNPATGVVFFRATSAGPDNFVGGGTHHRIPGSDETTAPNADGSNVWDNSAMEWECPNVGSFALEFTTTMNRAVSTDTFGPFGQVDGPDPVVLCYLFDSSNVLRQTLELPGVSTYDRTRTARFYLNALSGDVGETFHAVMIQAYRRMETPTLFADPILVTHGIWPATTADHYSNSIVTGWQASGTPSVAIPDQYIYANRHVPNVELIAFLIAVGDAFNLEIAPNVDDRTVTFTLKDRILENAPQNTTDQSARMIGDVELDHQRATTGLRLKWDIEKSTETPVNPVDYEAEENVVAPYTLGLWARIRPTRKLLKSAFDYVEGVFYWDHVGYDVPDRVVGDPVNAKEVVPAFKPLHMEEITKDDERYHVPVLDAAGSSNFFHGVGDTTTLWLCEFKKSDSKSGAVEDVPLARSWGYGWTSTEKSRLTLLWDNDDADLPGVHGGFWARWAQFLTAAEPVTMDLLVDAPFLRGNQWRRIMHIHGQNYLLERMPVEYGTSEAQLISRGAYLLRMMPNREAINKPVLPLPFMCVGEGYGAVELESGGTIYGQGSNGYITVRSADGTLTTIVNGELDTSFDPGTYCIWASDAAGEPSGDLTDLVILALIPGISLTGWTNLTSLQIQMSGTSLDLTGPTYFDYLDFLYSTALETVVVPMGLQIGNLVGGSCALDVTSMDLLCNALDPTVTGKISTMDGGTNAPPTGTSLANRTAYIGNGNTLATN